MAARSDRKSQQAAMTRVAIIEGAVRAFARKGIEAATMADIAGESGYSAPTLYNYFDNKEAIVEALYQHLFSEHTALLDDPLPADLTFAQKLEILVLRKFEFEHRHSEAIALMMQPRPAVHAQQAERLMHGFTQLMSRYASWIEQAAQPEELHGWDPTDLAFLLWSVHHSVQMRAMLLGDHVSANPAEQAKLVLEFFLHGLEGRPAPTPNDRGE